tara:strand:+ start:277 stop:411 length:135 start_codon:yes stop_codon:yes gene_type:complete
MIKYILKRFKASAILNNPNKLRNVNPMNRIQIIAKNVICGAKFG